MEKIIFHRNLDNPLIKIGIDGGGGFLKNCLNIFHHDHYSEVINKAPKNRKFDKYLNSGVKKILILAIVPEVQENYSNAC